MTTININYDEYKNRIKQNLNIFFKEDKFINNIIDNDIISMYNLHIINNVDNFKEYIIDIAKKYIFTQFINDYKKIGHFNNEFILNYIELTINDNSTLQVLNNYIAYFRQFADTILYNRYKINETIKYHTYSIYSVDRKIKEIKEKFENDLIQMNEELTYSISNLKKETEEQINENLIILDNYVDKRDFKYLFKCQKEINSIKNLKIIVMFNIMFQFLFITFYYWSM